MAVKDSVTFVEASVIEVLNASKSEDLVKFFSIAVITAEKSCSGAGVSLGSSYAGSSDLAGSTFSLEK